MKLSAWARANGVTRFTAYRWFHAGKLPVPARQLDTGTILVDVPAETLDQAVSLYARVSSHDQRDDLARQAERLEAWAVSRGYAVRPIETEIGSALDGKRPKLLRLLRDDSVKTIVVEHRDRLTRFGFEQIEAALGATGRRVLVADDTELSDDLVRDMLEVLTAFCARLYGRRSAARRAQRALDAAGSTSRATEADSRTAESEDAE